MHTGRYAALLAADVQAAGGILTVQDLATAQPQVDFMHDKTLSLSR